MNTNNPMTPGVYTVEKDAFPNAVAAVPTAIPAFIGYTAMALRDGKPITEPLLINSMAEFEQFFGRAPANLYPINEVPVAVDPATKQKTIPDYDFEVSGHYYKIGEAGVGNAFYLYHCMALFYQNGGGPCYIVSIGTYEVKTKVTSPSASWAIARNEPKKDHFLTGLAELLKIESPKPTMILAPDSLLLSSEDYFAIQQAALMQCGELKDRVALIDVYNGYLGLEDDVITNFRDKIGDDHLSYGISHYPFLKTTIVGAAKVTYANIDQTSPGAVALSSIFDGETKLKTLAEATDDLENTRRLVITPPLDFTKIAPLPTSGSDTDVSYLSWRMAFNAFPPEDGAVAILQWQLRVLYYMALTIYELGQRGKLVVPDVAVSNPELKKVISQMMFPTGPIIDLLATLYTYDLNFKIAAATTSTKTTKAVNSLGVLTADNLANLGITADVFKANTKLNSPVNPYPTTTPPQTEGELFQIVSPLLNNGFKVLNNAIGRVAEAAQVLIYQYNTALVSSNVNYKALMSAVASKAGILPPSAAIAGVMSLVDSSEGVWTAPANRNINSVTELTVKINDTQQAGLNVDALAGKSINAIRSFFGRGPAIIWGARTLDGNSNDWRYINIRRTAIMIEQSVVSAVQSLVFEPNDATTWRTCESMISNFLHTLWSEGALQGVSSSDASDASVGLGKTMTPEDVLDGIMRVEVKVALMHPGEFLVITIGQQMATS